MAHTAVDRTWDDGNSMHNVYRLRWTCLVHILQLDVPDGTIIAQEQPPRQPDIEVTVQPEPRYGVLGLIWTNSPLLVLLCLWWLWLVFVQLVNVPCDQFEWSNRHVLWPTNAQYPHHVHINCCQSDTPARVGEWPGKCYNEQRENAVKQ